MMSFVRNTFYTYVKCLYCFATLLPGGSRVAGTATLLLKILQLVLKCKYSTHGSNTLKI